MKWVITFFGIALLLGCSSGGSSSGTGGANEPVEVSQLTPEYQSYVRGNIVGYIRGEPTSINTRTRVMTMGNVWDISDNAWRRATLVHEACHSAGNHKGCNPENERQCNKAAAGYLQSIGEFNLAKSKVWLELDGEHCY